MPGKKIKMHNPETGAEIEVFESSQKFHVKAGWVAGEKPKKAEPKPEDKK